MFLGMLTRFFLSFLVSNWIYSEAVLLFPPLDPVAKKVYQTAQIPTHDKWGAIAAPGAAQRLANDIDVAVARNTPSFGASLSSFFDQQVRSIWKTGSFQSVGNFLGSSTRVSSKPFLSGEDIFSHRVAAVLKHDTF